MKKIEAKAAQAQDLDKDGKIEEWEVEEAMNTLMKAEKIKADPVKMKKVQALAGRHHKALKAIRSVQDIKDVYDQKFGSGAKKKEKLDL